MNTMSKVNRHVKGNRIISGFELSIAFNLQFTSVVTFYIIVLFGIICELFCDVKESSYLFSMFDQQIFVCTRLQTLRVVQLKRQLQNVSTKQLRPNRHKNILSWNKYNKI